MCCRFVADVLPFNWLTINDVTNVADFRAHNDEAEAVSQSKPQIRTDEHRFSKWTVGFNLSVFICVNLWLIEGTPKIVLALSGKMSYKHPNFRLHSLIPTWWILR